MSVNAASSIAAQDLEALTWPDLTATGLAFDESPGAPPGSQFVLDNPAALEARWYAFVVRRAGATTGSGLTLADGSSYSLFFGTSNPRIRVILVQHTPSGAPFVDVRFSEDLSELSAADADMIHFTQGGVTHQCHTTSDSSIIPQTILLAYTCDAWDTTAGVTVDFPVGFHAVGGGTLGPGSVNLSVEPRTSASGIVGYPATTP